MVTIFPFRLSEFDNPFSFNLDNVCIDADFISQCWATEWFVVSVISECIVYYIGYRYVLLRLFKKRESAKGDKHPILED